MDAPVQYLEELRGELALYPTWFPGDPIELGTFGVIRDGRFIADGRLAELDITAVPKRYASEHEVNKHRGVKLRAAAAAAAAAGLIDAEAGVDFEVERDYAWFFAARGMTSERIDNILEVSRGVLEARRRGDWRRDWLLISEVRHVEHLNVLVVRSKATRGRLRAKGTIASLFDILLQTDLQISHSSDDVFQVPNARSTTPLYGVRRLKGFFDPSLEPVGSRGSGSYGAAPSRGEDVALEESLDEPFFP